jgi:hypothetical protein
MTRGAFLKNDDRKLLTALDIDKLIEVAKGNTPSCPSPKQIKYNIAPLRRVRGS